MYVFVFSIVVWMHCDRFSLFMELMFSFFFFLLFGLWSCSLLYIVDTGEDDSRARRGGTGGDDDLTAGLDGTSNTSAAPPSLDVRTKFASNLFRLNGEELGYVLQMIDLRCPHAVESIRPSREEPEDYGDDVKREKDVEAEINVDAIDPKTFAELDRYIKERLYSRDAASSSSHHHHHHHHHHNTVKDGLSMTASATATTSGTTASQKRRKTK
jgi:hypothetical protein